MRTTLAALALVLSAALAHAQEMQPGLWEVVTTMRMQGAQMPGGRFTHCYTARDIAAGRQYAADKGKCTVSNMKTGGGSVSYDMSCPMEGATMTGSVKGTLSANAYTFDQKMRMTPDQGMGEMHSIIKGRRLGDCK
jgi:hypothetical protein